MKASFSSEKPTLSDEAAKRILRIVPSNEGFYFSRGIGDYTGQVATSLADFAVMLRTVDSKSIDFHMERRDFERWVRNVFGDEELAQGISQKNLLRGENRRNELIMVTAKRIDEIRKTQKTK